MDPIWASWVDDSLQQLDQRHLTRVLRPLLPTASAVEARIHPRQLEAWLEGGPACSDPQSLASLAQLAAADAAAAALAAASATAAAAAAGAAGGDTPQNQQQQQQQQQQPGGGGAPRLRLFGLNDYLGLSAHPDVCQAAAAAVLTSGMGPRASALVAGFTAEHRALELELARLKGAEDCLLFPTGFAANMAVISVLASGGDAGGGSGATSSGSGASSGEGTNISTSGSSSGGGSGSGGGGASTSPDVIILSDELNHASIIDGARLAARTSQSVSLRVYRHGDLAHLEQLLRSCPEGARKLVVTDGLFSMDGDFADLRGLARLKRRYGFLLVVDDAHATLVAGPHGGGTAEMQGATSAVDVHVGTLSKAAGCLGGFAACSSKLRSLLLNRGRAVVFSTALPVPVVAAARAALRVSQREAWRRRHVWALVRRLSDALGVPAHSPVIPLVIGPEAATMEAARQLLARGFHVGAIRPPTVAPGTCRLRISLSAAHSFSDVDDLASAVRECLGPGPLALRPLPHLLRPAPWSDEWAAAQRALDEQQRREEEERGGGGGGGPGRRGAVQAPRPRL